MRTHTHTLESQNYKSPFAVQLIKRFAKFDANPSPGKTATNNTQQAFISRIKQANNPTKWVISFSFWGSF
jgi:hypothetical protein